MSFKHSISTTAALIIQPYNMEVRDEVKHRGGGRMEWEWMDTESAQPFLVRPPALLDDRAELLELSLRAEESP